MVLTKEKVRRRGVQSEGEWGTDACKKKEKTYTALMLSSGIESKRGGKVIVTQKIRIGGKGNRPGREKREASLVTVVGEKGNEPVRSSTGRPD